MFAKDIIWSIFGLVFIVFGDNPDLRAVAVRFQIFSSATQRYVLSEYQPFLFSENRWATYNFLQFIHRIFSALAGRFMILWAESDQIQNLKIS